MGRERCVDDKVAVITDDGSGLHLAHSKGQTGRSVRLGLRRAELAEVVQDFGVRERDDFDRDTLFPLRLAGDQSTHDLSQKRLPPGELTVVPKMCEFFR